MGLSIHRFSHEAMSTFFQVLLCGPDPDKAKGVADWLFNEIDHIEGLLSRFDPCSDIGMINRLKPGESLRVSPDTLECLLIALWAYQETSGAFDVTVGPLMDVWRPLLKMARESVSCQPDPDLLSETLSQMGMGRLWLDPEERMVGIHLDKDEPSFPGLKLDLGGIGKGYALDKASEILEDWDVEAALLDSGTSTVLALGACPEAWGEESPGRGWPVGVGGPWGEAAGLHRADLVDGAVSGSGTEVKGDHILDPRSGRPIQHHLAAWAWAPSAAVADALSTAFMVMSTEEVKRFCTSHEGIRAAVVSPEGVLKAFSSDGSDQSDPSD